MTRCDYEELEHTADIYNAPAGALGHAVAKLFGADPKSELDDDLVRLKSLIEYGKASVGGTTVTREDVDLADGPERGVTNEYNPQKSIIDTDRS
jgi:hypothetical protein